MQGDSLAAQLVKNLPAMWETLVDPWVGKIPWRKECLPTPVFLPGEFHGYSPGVTESDTTEQLTLSLQFQRVCKPHSCIFVKWVQAVGGMIVLSAPRSDPSSTVEEKYVCTLFPAQRTDMVKTNTSHTTPCPQ